MKDKPYIIPENEPEASIAQEPAAVYGSLSIFDTIERARSGLKMSTVNMLASRLSFSLQEMGKILHLSLRTLQRYSPSKVLDTDASAKALKLQALQERGTEVFGSDEDFSHWLRQENPAFNNQKPLDMLETPYGFELIEQVLGRIEHGIFA